MNIEAELKKRAKEIEDRLYTLVPDIKDGRQRVLDAMRYSLEAGGKRLRPVLFMEFFRLAGGRDMHAALDMACAVEMIHTYSLIHDDLPCMDDDDMRRGKPSCHKAFDYATALLAGDGLLNLAFETMTSSVDPNGMKTAAYISKMSGVHGMIGGQTIDVCKNGCLSDLQELRNMVGMKTGALIKASCAGGCIFAGADSEVIACAERYAEYVGLAFQIRDDLLDAIGDEKLLGKKVGSDSKLCKTTFYTELGREECERRIRQLSDAALEECRRFSESEFIMQLTGWLAGRNI
ncbi:MAG: polyprenyl synthetase family protein [Clostridia bacterium]|nr:polyprenyl synthetase family protein [Clostridia bacterium]